MRRATTSVLTPFVSSTSAVRGTADHRFPTDEDGLTQAADVRNLCIVDIGASGGRRTEARPGAPKRRLDLARASWSKTPCGCQLYSTVTGAEHWVRLSR